VAKWLFRRFPFLLLNWAVRYFPILRLLKGRIPAGELLLDIGSGSFGLASFYRDRFAGCDLEFPHTPRQPMLPVRCSATNLPFGDASFPAVVISDVLEHLPPEHRLGIVQETLRVARNLAVFGFPCGSPAYESDRNFQEYLKARGIRCHDWLEEHLRHPFPDFTLFEGLDSEWSVESFGNENVVFHEWVNRNELSRLAKGLFWVLLTIVPHAVARMLRLCDRPPYYRLIVVATRKSKAGGAAAH